MGGGAGLKVLVTGATGFVGGAIVRRLLADGRHLPVAAVRSQRASLPDGIKVFQVGDLLTDSDWTDALAGVEVVIHAAARAHVMRDTAADPLAGFRRVNVEGMLNLASQAVVTGVRRFVFISSIGVNGNYNSSPFTELDTPHPVEPYAISKYEAEQRLLQLVEDCGMEVVIIRPPLVYGPNAPGNFGRLMRVVRKGIPLPLGAVCNKRSLVALDNLVDLIVTCLDHPAAANQVFLAGDGEDLSTTELLRRMGQALGKPARLIPVPAGLLMAVATLLGKRAVAQRLLGSLQVDISKARTLLGWTPPVSVDEGLRRTAGYFMGSLLER